MSNRQMDSRGEKALAVFLDRYFYPALQKEEGVSASRVYDAARQKQGVDVLITDEYGETYCLDEKAQLHYINYPRDTFAFELSFIHEKSGNVVDGWFVNEASLTDMFVLVWVEKARTDKIYRLVAEDFEKISLMIVPKQDLLEHLSKIGQSVEKIKETARSMREGELESKIRIAEDAFLFYSDKEEYVERPINLVLRRKTISRLAVAQYIVTKEAVVKE